MPQSGEGAPTRSAAQDRRSGEVWLTEAAGGSRRSGEGEKTRPAGSPRRSGEGKETRPAEITRRSGEGSEMRPARAYRRSGEGPVTGRKLFARRSGEVIKTSPPEIIPPYLVVKATRQAANSASRQGAGPRLGAMAVSPGPTPISFHSLSMVSPTSSGSGPRVERGSSRPSTLQQEAQRPVSTWPPVPVPGAASATGNQKTTSRASIHASS